MSESVPGGGVEHHLPGAARECKQEPINGSELKQRESTGRAVAGRSHVARAGPILPRPVLRERAGVRVIWKTRCLELATPDTWYFESTLTLTLSRSTGRGDQAHVRLLCVQSSRLCATGEASRKVKQGDRFARGSVWDRVAARPTSPRGRARRR